MRPDRNNDCQGKKKHQILVSVTKKSGELQMLDVRSSLSGATFTPHTDALVLFSPPDGSVEVSHGRVKSKANETVHARPEHT